jgi:hypothetical protein
MINRLAARRIAYERSLTGDLIHKTMSNLFPRRNDYGDGSFEELVTELGALGITCVGDFKRLMTHHRRTLLSADRAPLSQFERQLAINDYGADFVSDATRRQYWFAYPGLVRTAVEMHFGEGAIPSKREE